MESARLQKTVQDDEKHDEKEKTLDSLIEEFMSQDDPKKRKATTLGQRIEKNLRIKVQKLHDEKYGKGYKLQEGGEDEHEENEGGEDEHEENESTTFESMMDDYMSQDDPKKRKATQLGQKLEKKLREKIYKIHEDKIIHEGDRSRRLDLDTSNPLPPTV
jgi:gas vesicle protein